MKNKILITGANGFLGKHFLASIKDPENFYCLKPQKSKITDNLFHWGSREDFQGEKFQGVLHFATRYHGEDLWTTNYDLPLSLLDNAKDFFLNIGTVLESSTGPYAESKSKFSQKLKDSFRGQVIELKMQQFYGPFDGRFISFLIKSFLEKESSIDLTACEQKRDFIYISDVVRAINIIVENREELKATEVEVGSGESFSLKDIVLKVQELANGFKTNLNFGALDYRDGELMNSKADLSRLKRLGWSPEVILEKGLELTVQQMALEGNVS